MKKALLTITLIVLALTMQTNTGSASSSQILIDPQLTQFFATRAAGTTMPVVITYSEMPTSAELDRLQAAGIQKGFVMQSLPMVIADMNAGQLAAVRQQPGVVSIYSNRVMQNFTNAARMFIGLRKLAGDGEVIGHNTTNPTYPISGKTIGIGYVDTGIDGTHPDLAYGTKTVQNVIQPLSQGVVSDAGLVLGIGISVSDLIASTGFVPPLYIENQPMSDVESGHGTHGAGVAAGTGQASGNFYGGVARGAHLVGVNSGNDLGLPLVTILGAYDYLLSNQFRYNIRVINNSWGSSYATEEVDPNNPINVATRISHDRNIVVVFAAGNSGDTANAINPYSTLPWVISVAAGEKQGLGSPASFSSRGFNNGTGTDVAGMPANANATPNLRPDITGSGVDIKSTRSHGPGLTNTIGTVPLLGNDLTTIPPAFLPYYTTSQGTSFACPQVSGVVALMLEAKPPLNPDEVVTLLRQTANPMPYEERVVGAGYVDAHNAVRAAMSLTPVPHPFNLFPQPGGPEISDSVGDQFGTDAQDIVSADFAYDAATNQIVYTIQLKDMSVANTNMAWTQSSIFDGKTIFVTTAINELGQPVFQYGKIETTAAGTRQQTRLGAPDSGQIVGNRIIVRVAVSKLADAAALGYSPVGKTSTATEVIAQLRAGTTLTPSLLFPADTATGADFKVE